MARPSTVASRRPARHLILRLLEILCRKPLAPFCAPTPIPPTLHRRKPLLARVYQRDNVPIESLSERHNARGFLPDIVWVGRRVPDPLQHGLELGEVAERIPHSLKA